VSIKLLLAVIFLILSIGGLYPWVISNFAAPFPTLSLVFLALGGFLLADWLKHKVTSRARKKVTVPTPLGNVKVDQEKVVVGGLVGAAIAGTLLAAYLEGRKREATTEELRRMEEELEELLLTGKIDYSSYSELKKKIAALKVRQTQ